MRKYAIEITNNGESQIYKTFVGMPSEEEVGDAMDHILFDAKLEKQCGNKQSFPIEYFLPTTVCLLEIEYDNKEYAVKAESIKTLNFK
jgi:hypothetical protein